MRANGTRTFGGIEVLEAMSIEPPTPGAGQVRVKVHFAGVNPIDVHVRRGDFLGRDGQSGQAAIVLGYEGAGEVESIGPGVEGWSVGNRVAWCGLAGSHAELAVVPAWRLFPVPANVPLDIACAIQLDGLLAHALSVSVFPIKPDDRVLIIGGAEPASQLLVQIARAQGASVIAAVGRDVDQGGPKAAGADHVLVTSSGELADRVRALTDGQGCHVVYDMAGIDTAEAAIAACRRRGVVVLTGGRGGAVEPISPVTLAAAGSVYLTRPHLADYLQDETEIRWRMSGLIEAWSLGRLKVNVGRILPLEGAREGHLAIEAGTAAGKILIKV